MNERIKELFIQLFGKNNFPKGNAEVYMSAEDLEEFAELIVRECANIVQDSPWQLPQGYKSIDQAKLVKKYFGVEE